MPGRKQHTSWKKIPQHVVVFLPGSREGTPQYVVAVFESLNVQLKNI